MGEKGVGWFERPALKKITNNQKMGIVPQTKMEERHESKRQRLSSVPVLRQENEDKGSCGQYEAGAFPSVLPLVQAGSHGQLS